MSLTRWITLTALLLTVKFAVAQNDTLYSWLNDSVGVFYTPGSVQSGTFYKTTDSGLHWQARTISMDDGKNTMFLLSFNRPTGMLFFNDSTWIIPGFDGSFSYKAALLRSVDFGTTWSYQTFDVANASLTEERIHLADDTLGVLLFYDSYAVTLDAGATWETHKLPLKKRKQIGWPTMTFINGYRGLLRTNSETLFTNDGGRTWSHEENW